MHASRRLFLATLFATACTLALAPVRAGAVDSPLRGGGQDCTYTVGYWKTHPGAWALSTVTLGSVTYTTSQLDLVLAQPVQGNGLVSLSHQLVAAKLNIAKGANPAPVASVIAQADALIGARVCPPIGTGALLPPQVTSLVSTLDAYNSGLYGSFHCSGATASRQGTWGSLKSFHR